MTDIYIIAAIASSIAAFIFYMKTRRLNDALSSSRAQIYVLKRDIITADAAVRMYKMKLGELRSDAVVEFEKVGNNITVDEAMSFLKESTDDKN